MLLLVFAPQPPNESPELINFAQLLRSIYPALNASGTTDLTYWSETDLYQWFDEASQRLARSSGVFVSRDTSIAVSSGLAGYSLPSEQISTIQVDLAGAVLRPRTTAELEALDASWNSTVGPPSPCAFVQDTQGLLQISLYPAPGSADNEKTLGIVLHALPATIGSAYPYLSAPSVVQDYFALWAIGEARAAETKAAMPEVAQWCRQVCDLYEQTIEGLWGESQ